MRRCLIYYCYVLTALLVCRSLYGQSLKIGEPCPDLVLKNVVNYPDAQIRLSSLNKKLIILDFWGTGCTSCLHSFSKIDSLQKEFGEQLQIILVNPESRDSTLRFFAKRKKIKMPAVPLVTGDCLLSGLFPHDYVPHHVWLDSSLTVRYITDGYNATAPNIRDFLSGKPLSVAVKKDLFVSDQPLLAVVPDWKDQVVYYSALSHCLSGVDIGNGISSTIGADQPNRISCNCSSAMQLLQRAFSEGGKHDFTARNTICLEVKDPYIYDYPTDKDRLADWYRHHSYYYELMVPPSDTARLYSIMQQELTRLFYLDVRIEKRSIPCLVLERLGASRPLTTAGGKKATNAWTMHKDSIIYFYHQPFQQVATWLNRIISFEGLPWPFVDKTGYRGPVDLVLKTESITPLNLALLNSDLRKYGLVLREENCPMETLVIKEKAPQP